MNPILLVSIIAIFIIFLFWIFLILKNKFAERRLLKKYVETDDKSKLGEENRTNLRSSADRKFEERYKEIRNREPRIEEYKSAVTGQNEFKERRRILPTTEVINDGQTSDSIRRNKKNVRRIFNLRRGRR